MSKKILLAGAGILGGYMLLKSVMGGYAQEHKMDPTKVKKVGETEEGKWKVAIKGLPGWFPVITLDAPGVSGGLGSAIRSPFTVPPRSFMKRPRRIERIMSEIQYGSPEYLAKFKHMEAERRLPPEYAW